LREIVKKASVNPTSNPELVINGHGTPRLVTLSMEEKQLRTI
jgi:hypothetical protein